MSTSSKTESKPVRLAVVGAGMWGANHVRVLSELGVLEAVCDMSRARLESIKETYPHIRRTTALREILDDAAISGIVIASPARTHAEVAGACLGAGKDVLIEKPMALDLGEAEVLQREADESGRVMAVGHVLEYHPAVTRLRELVADGFVGRVRYLYANRLNFGRIRTEENVLWSFAPHDIALMIRLLGLPLDVACRGGAYLNPGVDDNTLTDLVFDSDVRAHIFVSWLHPFKEHRFVVVGDRRILVFDDTVPWQEKLVSFDATVQWIDGQIPVAHKAESEAIAIEECEPLKIQADAFIEAIQTRTPPLADGRSGVAVLRVLMAAQRSREQGGLPVGLLVGSDSFVHPTATVDAGATIGPGTRLWHYSHVMRGAHIGERCTLGQNVFVGADVRIGNDCKVQNNVSVYEGVTLEDRVFCGPSAVFTNVISPRAEIDRRNELRRTVVRQGATIGANATIVCGVEIGADALVGAGAVVTRDVPNNALVVGNPARVVGWVCRCGERLAEDGLDCQLCGRRYVMADTNLREES